MGQFKTFLFEIGGKITKNKIVRSILWPFYHPYLVYLEKKRNKLFLKYGLELLSHFDKILTEEGYEYTLIFGTLLGAVREKGFLKHDLDIDVAMWHDSYSIDLKNLLEKNGFKLDHEFLVNGGKDGLEQTYEYKGVTIDIFFFYPPINEYPYCCDFGPLPGSTTWDGSMKKFGYVLPRRLELPLKKSFIRVPFESLNLLIPANYDEILSFRYGKDYMIPNTKWSMYSENPHVIKWIDNLGTYIKSNR